MLHTMNPADDRIRDLQATAAALRTERILAARRRADGGPGIRHRLGTTLMAAGAALVSSSSPVSTSRAGR